MAAPVRRGAGGFQLASDIEMIVDLAIERHRETAAFAVHRLAACLRQVENGEPAVAESNAGRAMGPVTLAVRSAIGQRIGHGPRDGRKLAFVASAWPKQTRNAAHQPTLPCERRGGATDPSCNCRHSRSIAGETGFNRITCICRLSPKARVATSRILFAAWVTIPPSAGRASPVA